ncbi:Gfo/Idh/MocA family protein [Alicyclobacillus dauci]|uniref:Gfo/Idh/MocA family oxidoreductase n=1 Tax=Alicyclobacillus dauci TaxID=1475485 RepID=A0ABY6YZX9_9BACL|nr:Gfo/Idh/MocA family oxidoreductase [Alicyclobacillus dauci]WAH36024.1 Gfo/Idh/MocA family oxidoreductase [Alicyclobacillus dauci]
MQEDFVRMGLHGYGYIGRIHVLASQLHIAAGQTAPSINWESAVVRDLGTAAAKQARRVFPFVTDDISALSERNLEAIDIASPNHAHLAPFQLAVEKGWSIYCEKPISHDLSEATEMVEAASQADLVTQVALVYRFHPAVIEARDWLLSGKLGRPLTFRAELLHGGYLNPDRPMSWRLQNAASGGGAVMDLGIHLFDTLHMLLGPVDHLTATTRTFIDSRRGPHGTEPVTVDDWASATLTMRQGTVGTVEVSRVHYGRERDVMDIVCERGVLHIPLERYEGVSVTTLDDGMSVPVSHSPSLQPFSPKYAQSTLLNLHATGLAAFASRIRGASVDIPVPTVDDALAGQAVAHAVMESGRAGGDRVSMDRFLAAHGCLPRIYAR